MAEALGVSRQAVSLWENDVTSPGVEQLIGLALVLHCTPHDLLGWDEVAMTYTDGKTGKVYSPLGAGKPSDQEIGQPAA